VPFNLSHSSGNVALANIAKIATALDVPASELLARAETIVSS
jgi:hypothetical protein